MNRRRAKQTRAHRLHCAPQPTNPKEPPCKTSPKKPSSSPAPHPASAQKPRATSCKTAHTSSSARAASTAGIIIAHAENRVALDNILATDSYYPDKAHYEIREFTAKHIAADLPAYTNQ